MSDKDTMIHHKVLIAVLVLHVQVIRASWPLLQNLAMAPAPSNIWPGMRMMPAAGLAQASLIQPIALRDMQLAYPLQSLNIGQFAPMGPELASEQEILQFQRNQHRRRMHRERERMRVREREREHRERMRHRDMHPFATSVLRNERNKSNNLLESMELSDVIGKNRGGSSSEEISDGKQQSGERMRASSDDDFILLQKLNNEHIKTTSRPDPFNEDILHGRHATRGMTDMPPDPPTKPVDIRRKTMASPNGQVTYITEMLYDVGDGSGNLKVTRPPVPSFIPAPNEVMQYTPTDDPRGAPPFITIIPPASGVLSRPPEVIPATEWPTIPTPPTPFRSRSRTMEKNEQTEGSERRESNSFPNDKNSNNNHQDGRSGSSNFQLQNRHVQTERPNGFRSSGSSFPTSSNKELFEQTKVSSTGKEKTWKGSGEGLGAAAIAGIVIGSLVSITLLAGTTSPSLLSGCLSTAGQQFRNPFPFRAISLSSSFLFLSLPIHPFLTSSLFSPPLPVKALHCLSCTKVLLARGRRR